MLADDNFLIAHVRPPMIYGKGSKRNYIKLAGLARKVPLFQDYPNHRSMIHVDHLSEFLTLLILHENHGTFHPQNADYVCMSELVKTIGVVHGNHVRTTRFFNRIIRPLVDKNVTMNKLFGDFAYAKELSAYPHDYHVRDFFGNVVQTERHEPSLT